MSVAADIKGAVGAEVGEIAIIVGGIVAVVLVLYIADLYLNNELNQFWQNIKNGATDVGAALGGGDAAGEDNSGGLSLS